MAQINKPDEYFNTKLYTGTASSNSITGVGFQPDWVWIKEREDTQSSHAIFDIVRGAEKRLLPNLTNAENTDAQTLSSFDSDGFTLGTQGGVNGSGNTYVSWNWLADNTSGSANTDGSISSTVSANTTSGFSIVSYTGNGTSGSTVGHGLGATPAWIIVKNRDQTDKFTIFHQSLTNGANSYLELSGTNAESNLSLSPPFWGTPSSTTFGGLYYHSTNASGEKYIAYCFAEKKGFSKFGSYTGNGSTDGTFVYTGFKPAWVIWKRTDSSGYDWDMYDTARDTHNVAFKELIANSNVDESTSTVLAMDILSNGFKLRTTNANGNGSGATYIYMAFAENPLVGTNNIPAVAR